MHDLRKDITGDNRFRLFLQSILNIVRGPEPLQGLRPILNPAEGPPHFRVGIVLYNLCTNPHSRVTSIQGHTLTFPQTQGGGQNE